MGLLQSLMVSTLPAVPRRVVQRVAERYVAGETREEALTVVQQLNASGAMGTVDLLGEVVRRPEEAATATEEYLTLIGLMERRGVDANVSVKLTQLGLDLDGDLCRQNLERVALRARDAGMLVRLDMEDHSRTDATLQFYRELQPRLGNLGLVLQAMLRRTQDDIQQLGSLGANVRLCKGIYLEPPELAFQTPHEVRWSFVRCLDLLLEHGCYVGVATHDEVLMTALEDQVRLRELTPSQYELQMLLGVLPRLRERMIARGHRLRVYVPYGRDWYQYSMRRLRENPTVAGHVLRAALRLQE